MSKEAAFEVGRLYLPLKAIADTLVASQKDVFVRLPGLRGYYPMGIRNSSGHAIDHSNADVNLLQTGICPVGYDGNSFAHLGDGTNYLTGGSSFGMTGTETFITSSLRGITLGGWFMMDAITPGGSGLISKTAGTPDYGYALGVTSTALPFGWFSGTGASLLSAFSVAINTGQWYFIASRFIPSTEVAIFVDGDKTTNTTAIPASVNVSAQQFEIGRYVALDAHISHAKARDVFICSSALSDALIEEIRVTSTP